MLEIDGVTESITLCVFDVTTMSAIMFGRSVDVPTVDRVKGPCSLRISLLVQPMGTRGILLYSNGPLRWACAEMVGVALDWRSRLRVISVCGKSLSHKVSGKSSETPASMLRKCALKFQLATSVALHLWQPGGTSSYSM